MSFTSKVVLASACTFSLGIVGYVHFRQYLDREALHKGVLKDIERRNQRKMENLYALQQQIELTKQLQKARDEPEGVT
ncbi:protein PET117 homolog, mitochondrial [Cylas formicarius]|uniref:protein PET117 homolog, mitochondrial n=1 Tax=Cylas formicarius TaxID=197179 RepID=UPI002958AB4C|nr:protein PET117 homolog, mitochondrial [Cylas formicarius]